MLGDTYKTISEPAQAVYTEKRSKFIAFALPVCSQDEVRQCLASYEQQYFDARHVCYAYVLGPDGSVFRVNDNGEPSGTAGKPILGQIRSYGLTNVLVLVVRYFGGVKLGTGGLFTAYKTAANQALANAKVIEKTVDALVSVSVHYTFLSDLMRIIKEEKAELVDSSFDLECRITVRIRQSLLLRLTERLGSVRTLTVLDIN